METHGAPLEFEALGKRAARRFQWIHFLELANQSVAVGALSAALAVLLLRLLGMVDLAGGVVLSIWALACGLIARLNRLRPYLALAKWESLSGGKCILASAGYFETSQEPSPGEKLHLRRARSILPERARLLAEDLPLPGVHWSWVCLVLPVGLFLSPVGHRRAAPDENPALTAEMAGQAAREAAKIARVRNRLDDLEALSAEQTEAVQRLAGLLRETEDMLSDPEDTPRREVLEELDVRARAAEQLAAQLTGKGRWISTAMISGLERHADTAELAEAARARDADFAEQAADDIADALEASRDNAASHRIAQALRDAVSRATEQDQNRPVAQHLSGASAALEESDQDLARDEFRQLAHYLRDMAQQQRSAERMHDLASQLRQSGAEIANPGAGQRQMTNDRPPQGAHALAQHPPAPGPSTVSEAEPGRESAGQPSPEFASTQPATPEPGPSPTTQTPPGEQPAMAALRAPVPSEPAISGQSSMSVPGHKAGTGTGELNASPTNPLDAVQDGRVTATLGSEGDSTVTRIGGSAGKETALRTTQAGAAEFLAVEEAALDEKTLPAGRRDQVLRYFSALRRLMENQ